MFVGVRRCSFSGARSLVGRGSVLVGRGSPATMGALLEEHKLEVCSVPAKCFKLTTLQNCCVPSSIDIIVAIIIYGDSFNRPAHQLSGVLVPVRTEVTFLGHH